MHATTKQTKSGSENSSASTVGAPVVEIQPLSRQWVKDTSNPAIVLIAKGAEYLTLLAALRWASNCGPGPERRRHGGYAYERLVADLPAARPETILHRKELLALVDGLEHFAVLDDETGANARALLNSVRTTVQMHGEARGR